MRRVSLGKVCNFKIPKIESWKPGRHPMTTLGGIPHILAENVVYKLDVESKTWVSIARIPGSQGTEYRVRYFILYLLP